MSTTYTVRKGQFHSTPRKWNFQLRPTILKQRWRVDPDSAYDFKDGYNAWQKLTGFTFFGISDINSIAPDYNACLIGFRYMPSLKQWQYIPYVNDKGARIFKDAPFISGLPGWEIEFTIKIDWAARQYVYSLSFVDWPQSAIVNYAVPFTHKLTMAREINTWFEYKKHSAPVTVRCTQLS